MSEAAVANTVGISIVDSDGVLALANRITLTRDGLVYLSSTGKYRGTSRAEFRTRSSGGPTQGTTSDP